MNKNRALAEFVVGVALVASFALASCGGSGEAAPTTLDMSDPDLDPAAWDIDLWALQTREEITALTNGNITEANFASWCDSLDAIEDAVSAMYPFSYPFDSTGSPLQGVTPTDEEMAEAMNVIIEMGEESNRRQDDLFDPFYDEWNVDPSTPYPGYLPNYVSAACTATTLAEAP